MFARDADTGEAVWAYQFTPHDQWDYDGVNEMMLLDLPVEGRFARRWLISTATLTSTCSTAAPERCWKLMNFAYQNWSLGFDKETGKPIMNPAEDSEGRAKVERICPPDIGQKDWEPPAFSPRTGLIYAGVFNICMDLTNHKVSYIAGTPYDGMEMTRDSVDGKDGDWGAFIAWDPVDRRKRAWTIPEKFMVMSGALATGGDVVFYGTTDGWFARRDARSGEVLWQQKLSSGMIGQPTLPGP